MRTTCSVRKALPKSPARGGCWSWTEAAPCCALLGDNIAAMAHQNGWAGVIVHGCIRDGGGDRPDPDRREGPRDAPEEEFSPRKARGDRDIAVTFAGVTWVPGELVYADHDGINVCAQAQLA